jgi:protein-L-isoaspartate(D-aspartate) O-methyltransferase
MLTAANGRELTPAGAARLAADLERARAAGAIIRYHYLRKDHGLRLRVAPAGPIARNELALILDSLAASGEITGWARGIYEPEVHAFGGPAAMEVAHQLFCADSRAVLASQRGTGSREAAALLASALLRAAGMDWYEQGDVWARVAAHRPAAALPPARYLDEARAAMRQLMSADSVSARLAGPGWTARLDAFQAAGRELGSLARGGHLARGLRAVLAHHLIFAFNRAGLSSREQGAMASLAQEATMRDRSSLSPSRHSRPASIRQVENTSAAPHLADGEAARLRSALTDSLRDRKAVRSEEVAAAFRAVPRHLFVPGATLAEAYADAQVFTKRTDAGVPISAASQPAIVAMMLEQLGVRPGHAILEIGAGTGYNAALIGHLAGQGGHVTTIDVDADLVSDARDHLAAAGADNVTAVLADGALGHPDAPFDRIIVTAGAGDIPPAWLDQLAPGGRLVLPLRIRGGVSRSIALERDGTSWRAVSSEMCTFMPLRGMADDTRLVIPLVPDGQVSLHTYRDQHADPAALASVLEHPGIEVGTGILFRKGDPWEWLDLWLACVLPGGVARMPQAGPAVESGWLRPQFPWGAMAAVDAGSIAYLTLREGEDEAGRFWEAGVIGHGPGGGQLAAGTAEAIRAWGDGYRDRRPEIRLAQGQNRSALTGQFIIDKALTRLLISWK